MRIWKFPLRITDLQTVSMPFGSQVLSAQFQHGVLNLWALCDENQPIYEGRSFHIIGTGNPMPDVEWSKYIATVQHHDGALVWHVFEQ